ncbi:MAG: acyl-CoA dehydrogenase family protein [Dehalococcoidia bacterium]|nr:acyl-CoA dehydrogenase family protein [Dehalococcoidia bacterium]
MDLDFTEEQKMFQKSVRDFARTEVAPLVDRAEKDEMTPVQLFPTMGQLGYLCVHYPAEYGAAGLGEIENCILIEEMSRIAHGICGSIMVHSGVGTSAIKDHGSTYLKERYLVSAIKGTMISCFGLSEACAGSDAASIQTTAKKSGGNYILNGSKMYITNGSICDFSTVAAYTDKSKSHRGISLFAVGKDTPGFARAKLHKFCIRSSDTAEFSFNESPVPAENLIGEEGRGFQYLMETLDIGRISHAASRLGAAQEVSEMTLEYAKQRVQFGRPIASNQAIAFKLARMAMDIESLRWMVYRAAWLYDNNRPCAKEASMTKLLASEVYQRTAVEAAQIHGGATALEESPINRHYRDAYIGRITEGTSEIQELVIARQLGIKDLK